MSIMLKILKLFVFEMLLGILTEMKNLPSALIFIKAASKRTFFITFL